MPKQKSHSGAKKRVRRTGSGKIAVKRSGRSHLLLQKSKRQKNLSRTLIPSKTEGKSIRSLLPYL
ncbi:MAG: 50S ribosomal protein L35 [Candidatus Peribacteraceae bacterium]